MHSFCLLFSVSGLPFQTRQGKFHFVLLLLFIVTVDSIPLSVSYKMHESADAFILCTFFSIRTSIPGTFVLLTY